MQARTGCFTDGEQAGHWGFAVYVAVDAAHHEMDDRANRHRVRDRIMAHVGRGQFPDQRQALVDFLFAQVAHVEQHAMAPGRFHRVALAVLVPEGLAEAVARAQFHGFEFRLADRCFRAHTVILQVAVSILVHQDAAFAAATLGQ